MRILVGLLAFGVTIMVLVAAIILAVMAIDTVLDSAIWARYLEAREEKAQRKENSDGEV